MLPYSSFDPAAKHAKIDVVSGIHNLGRSVPFGLRQSDNLTTLCGTSSQQGVDVADTVNTVYRFSENVERADRELVQPKPRSGGFVDHAGGLLHRPRFPSLSSRCLLRFLHSLFTTCWGQHS